MESWESEIKQKCLGAIKPKGSENRLNKNICAQGQMAQYISWKANKPCQSRSSDYWVDDSIGNQKSTNRVINTMIAIGLFHQSLVQIGPVASEELIKM
jgi:hypothetical protein